MGRLASRSRWAIALSALALVAWSCAPGDLDLRFGSSGKVTTDFGHGSAEARGLVRQPDGKIVAAGYTNGVTGHVFALARYNRDGSLDRTFGIGGTVTKKFSSSFDDINAVALAAGGKIVVAGRSGDSLALARFTGNGSIDPSFGTSGLVVAPIPFAFNGGNGVALQPDGKIVVAAGEPRGNTDFAVLRYNENGTPDLGFGSGGKVNTDFGREDVANAVVVQRNGRIVAAGISIGQGYAVAGYRPDGTPDPAFGTGGTVTTNFPDATANAQAYAIARSWDDSLIVVGSAGGNGEGFGLARYSANGVLDQSFGIGGTVTTPFDDFGEARAVALGRHGEIVVAGASPFSTVFDDFLVARYRPDGTLDRRFGQGGRVTTDFFGAADHARAVVLQPDGAIVVGGLAQTANGEEFALARYLGRGFGHHDRPH